MQSVYGNDKSVQHLTLDQDKRTKQSVLARCCPWSSLTRVHTETLLARRRIDAIFSIGAVSTHPEYHQNLMRFQRALQQRNQLLKQCKVLDSAT